MKTCVLVKPGLVEMQDRVIPEPGTGEVLVSIRAALTCGTDLKMYRRGHPLIPLPSPFGHEFSGVVAGTGPGVDGFQEGDEIMAVHSGPCEGCSECRAERAHLCENLMETKVLGAFAEYVLLPAHVVRTNLFRKPAQVSFPVAALLEPLSCVVHGIDSLGVRAGETAAVIGAGSVGLLHTAYLKHLGLRVVTGDTRSVRVAAARELGADQVLTVSGGWVEEFKTALGEAGADHVFECTGEAEVWEGAIWLPRRGGTVTLFGGLAEGTQVMLDAGRIHYDAITLRGVFHFGPGDVRKAYDLIASQALPLDGLITGEFPLYQIDFVFDRLVRGEGIKYALAP